MKKQDQGDIQEIVQEKDKESKNELNVASILETSILLLNNTTISNSDEEQDKGAISPANSSIDVELITEAAICQKDLDTMEINDLLDLCKKYRNRVMENALEGDILTLQTINTVLENKMKMALDSISTFKTDGKESKEKEIDLQVSSILSTSQLSTTSTDIQNEANEEELPTFRCKRVEIQSASFSLYPKDSLEEEEPIEIRKLPKEGKEKEFIVEELEGTGFQSEQLKSLSFNPFRIRRRVSFAKETSLKQSVL